VKRETGCGSRARTNINLYGQAFNEVSLEEFSGVVAQVADVNIACGKCVGLHPPRTEKKVGERLSCSNGKQNLQA
jgi:hypothetical protein